MKLKCGAAVLHTFRRIRLRIARQARFVKTSLGSPAFFHFSSGYMLGFISFACCVWYWMEVCT